MCAHSFCKHLWSAFYVLGIMSGCQCVCGVLERGRGSNTAPTLQLNLCSLTFRARDWPTQAPLSLPWPPCFLRMEPDPSWLQEHNLTLLLACKFGDMEALYSVTQCLLAHTREDFLSRPQLEKVYPMLQGFI
jgi:hypothetical protein